MTIEITVPIGRPDVICAVGDYVESIAGTMAGNDAVTFRVVRLDTRQPLQFIGTLVRQLRAGGIVHLNLPIEGWGNSLLPGAALFLARLLTRRGKTVLTLHEWKSLNKLRFLSQLPDLWAADQVILVSREQWEAFRASKSPPKRLRDGAALIPIGANVRGEAPPVAARQRAEGDALVVGYFGVLYSSKQPELMLRAIAALKQRGTKVKLLIAGDFLPDKPQDKALFFGLAEELGIADCIDFRGRIEASEDVLKALSEADVQMLLFSDGASARRSSLLTALLLERPVVTTAPFRTDEFQDWPEIEQQLADGGISTVAPDASPEAVAEALLAAVTAHPTRPRIDSGRIWGRVAADHAALYARVTGVAPRPNLHREMPAEEHVTQA